MSKFASIIVGLVILLGGTVGCFMLAGNSPAVLFFFVPSLAMLLIPLGCSTIAFGFRGPQEVLRAFAALWSADPKRKSEAARVISACIGHVYAAGAFVFLASLLSILASVPELETSGFGGLFGRNVAATIASLMYPVVLAELVLRPVKQRLA